MDMLYMVRSAFVLTGSFWSQISEGSPGGRALFHTSTAGWQRKRRQSWESVDLSKFWKWELLRGRGYIRGGGHTACGSEGAGWYTHASNRAKWLLRIHSLQCILLNFLINGWLLSWYLSRISWRGLRKSPWRNQRRKTSWKRRKELKKSTSLD